MSSPIVLVVEDEPLLRLTTMDMVEQAGFVAIEAANAAEAIDALTTHQGISVVLSDIDMPPGMDGLTLAAIVRDRWPPIEIIFISGQRTPLKADMPERSLFFSKPYVEREVVEALRRLTGTAAKSRIQ